MYNTTMQQLWPQTKTVWKTQDEIEYFINLSLKMSDGSKYFEVVFYINYKFKVLRFRWNQTVANQMFLLTSNKPYSGVNLCNGRGKQRNLEPTQHRIPFSSFNISLNSYVIKCHLWSLFTPPTSHTICSCRETTYRSSVFCGTFNHIFSMVG